MRENPPKTTSVLERFSNAAAGDDQSAEYNITIGNLEESTTDVEAELDELMAQVTGALPTDDVTFDEALIKENLDEILLMLISLHGETHGKQLLSDLTHLFGAQLSPGTVYPSLHALEESDVLSMHAKVRTKEYAIDDDEVVRGTVERAMVQHLAFGLLLYAFLPKLD